MNAGRRKIDNATVMSATHRASQRLFHMRKNLEAIQNDPDKADRLDKQQCAICYYVAGRLGGAAMPSIQCGLCDEILHFGNTCVDILCKGCAAKHRLCVHCGGDIELKQRKKQRF